MSIVSTIRHYFKSGLDRTKLIKKLEKEGVWDLLKAKADQYGFDIDYLLAIIYQESGYYSTPELEYKTVSRTSHDAWGFMQIRWNPNKNIIGPVEEYAKYGDDTLGTPEQVQDTFATDPPTNIALGCWYLNRIRQQYLTKAAKVYDKGIIKGSLEELAFIAGSYNGGPVIKYSPGDSAPQEPYWAGVLAHYQELRKQNITDGSYVDPEIAYAPEPIIEGPAGPSEIRGDEINLKPIIPKVEPVQERIYLISPEALVDNGYLRINDIVFNDIKPGQITVTRQSLHKETGALRTGHITKLRTGQSRINVRIVLDFLGIERDGKTIPSWEYINEKLLPLIAQLRQTPFCQVENEYLHAQIGNLLRRWKDAKSTSWGQLSLALSSMVCATHPEIPGGLQVTLDFIYFNYRPYSTNFQYLKNYDAENWVEAQALGKLDKEETDELRELTKMGRPVPIKPPEESESQASNLWELADSAIDSSAWRTFYKAKIGDIGNSQGLSAPMAEGGPSNHFKLNFELSSQAEVKDNKAKFLAKELDLYDDPAKLEESGGMVPIDMRVSFYHRLALLPLNGWEYPTIQYLGTGDTVITINLQAIGKEGAFPALQALQHLYSLMERRAIEDRSTRIVGLQVQNDILELFGFRRAIIDSLTTETTNNPEIRNVTMVLKGTGFPTEGLKWANRNLQDEQLFKLFVQSYLKEIWVQYVPPDLLDRDSNPLITRMVADIRKSIPDWGGVRISGHYSKDVYKTTYVQQDPICQAFDELRKIIYSSDHLVHTLLWDYGEHEHKGEPRFTGDAMGVLEYLFEDRQDYIAQVKKDLWDRRVKGIEESQRRAEKNEVAAAARTARGRGYLPITKTTTIKSFKENLDKSKKNFDGQLRKWARQWIVELGESLRSPEFVEAVRDIGQMSGISYPDFVLGDLNNLETSIINGIALQDLNPDFYFYNHHDDPGQVREATETIFEKAQQEMWNAFDGYNKAFFKSKGILKEISSIGQSPDPGDVEAEKEAKKQTITRLNREGLNDLLEYTKKNFRPAHFTMRRAYPTFQLYFLEEDDQQVWRAYNDFYSTESIDLISVIRSRKIPADVAYIRINNLTGALTTKKFYGGPEEESKDPRFLDTEKENPCLNLVLKEGTRIQIRLGYDNDPNKLKTVFNGQITNITDGEVLEIYCQSYATELISNIIGAGKGTHFSEENIFTKLVGGKGYEADTEAIVQNLLKRAEVRHFGRWKLNDGFDFLKPLRSFMAEHGTLGLLEAGELRPDGHKVARWGIVDSPVDDNIFVPREDFPSRLYREFLRHKKLFFAKDATIWEILQELTVRYPNIICSIIPYQDRSTLFFGFPDQAYLWRDRTWKEKILEGSRLKDKIAGTREELKEARWESLTWPTADPFSGKPPDPLKPFKLPPDVGAIKDRLGDLETKLKYGSGSMKRFREYHLLTSETDIISNEIRADATNTFNVCQVFYGDDGESKDIIIKADKSLPDPGLAMHGEESQALANFRVTTVDARNAATKFGARLYGIAEIAHSLKDLYKGELLILGNPDIKPYDICTIFDSYNEISGPIEVEQVVHTFSQETGFVTAITPDCLVNVADCFSASWIDSIVAGKALFYYDMAKTLFPGIKIGDSRRAIPDPELIAAGDAILTIGGAMALATFPISAIFVGIGGIKLFREMADEEPLIITPLIKYNIPWLIGMDGFKRDGYWARKKEDVERYVQAAISGIGFVKTAWNALTGEAR